MRETGCQEYAATISAVLLLSAHFAASRNRVCSSYFVKLACKERYARRSGWGNGRGLNPERMVGAKPVTRIKPRTAIRIALRQKRAERGSSSSTRVTFLCSKR